MFFCPATPKYYFQFLWGPTNPLLGRFWDVSHSKWSFAILQVPLPSLLTKCPSNSNGVFTNRSVFYSSLLIWWPRFVKSNFFRIFSIINLPELYTPSVFFLDIHFFNFALIHSDINKWWSMHIFQSVPKRKSKFIWFQGER